MQCWGDVLRAVGCSHQRSLLKARILVAVYRCREANFAYFCFVRDAVDFNIPLS